MSENNKWYVLHTVSGSENKIKNMIEDQISKKSMQEYFEEIVIPTIQKPRIVRGKQVIVEQKFMPGYVLIKMNMTDESWHLVKSVPKLSGFLGSKTVPEPLSQREVDSIFSQVEKETKNAADSAIYSLGDKVKVIDGPFDSFSGVVEEVNSAEQKLQVAVSIFGKLTPIELSFSQVSREKTE